MTNLPDLLYRFRWQVTLLLVGVILAAAGVFISLPAPEPQFEVVEEDKKKAELIVEVSGAVENPGVYKLPAGKRIEDALKLAGGVASYADLEWIAKYLNRAAPIIDGQKIYIPTHNATGNSTAGSPQVLAEEPAELININTASLSELDSLSGIGPVYAKKIIDNRPYSTVEELLVKKIITQKIYDENKDKMTVY